MMRDNFVYYVMAFALIIAVVFIIKKVASCMVKVVAFLILIAILVGGYFYFQYFS